MKYFLYLLFLILALIFNINSFAKGEDKNKKQSDNQFIKIDKIYEKTLSPDGKFAIAKVLKGENETGLYFINAKTKNLISPIIPFSSGGIRNLNVIARWNNTISKVAMLICYGRVNIDLEIFLLESKVDFNIGSKFSKVLFDYPDTTKNNKKLEEDSEVFFRQDICGLGTWIDNNTVSFVTGRYYEEKTDGDIHYLVSFNVHITPTNRSEVQEVKVIGRLTDDEYNTFEASHNYQFGEWGFP